MVNNGHRALRTHAPPNRRFIVQANEITETRGSKGEALVSIPDYEKKLQDLERKVAELEKRMNTRISGPDLLGVVSKLKSVVESRQK